MVKVEQISFLLTQEVNMNEERLELVIELSPKDADSKVNFEQAFIFQGLIGFANQIVAEIKELFKQKKTAEMGEKVLIDEFSESGIVEAGAFFELFFTIAPDLEQILEIDIETLIRNVYERSLLLQSWVNIASISKKRPST